MVGGGGGAGTRIVERTGLQVPVQLYRYSTAGTAVTGCGSEDSEVLKALYPSKSPSLWGGGNLVLTSQPVNPDLHIPVHVHLYVYNYLYL